MNKNDFIYLVGCALSKPTNLNEDPLFIAKTAISVAEEALKIIEQKEKDGKLK